MGYYAAIKKAERDEFNRELKAAAFTAWRFEVVIGSLFGGQANITYTDYAEKMGLLTDEEKEHNAAIKEMQKLYNKHVALAASIRADEIIKMDKAADAKKRGLDNGGSNGGF